MGQIPCSTERISSLHLTYDIPDVMWCLLGMCVLLMNWFRHPSGPCGDIGHLGHYKK